MKLTKEQKNQIYNKNMIVDDWEWVPCINHVLRILNYDDNLIHDENYETVKWSGTEPLIKDENKRKIIRACANLDSVKDVKVLKRYSSNTTTLIFDKTTLILKGVNEYDCLQQCGTYTINELCGEEEE